MRLEKVDFFLGTKYLYIYLFFFRLTPSPIDAAFYSFATCKRTHPPLHSKNTLLDLFSPKVKIISLLLRIYGRFRPCFVPPFNFGAQKNDVMFSAIKLLIFQYCYCSPYSYCSSNFPIAKVVYLYLFASIFAT